MLNRTTEMAIRALLVMGLEQSSEPVKPKVLAERLECSPSYLSKTLALLTRAGILQSLRGARGGVLLRKETTEITLQNIVEACQGVLVGTYCRQVDDSVTTCGYHSAMSEIYEATLAVLARWTLADMMAVPVYPGLEAVDLCKMYFHGCDHHCRKS